MDYQRFLVQAASEEEAGEKALDEFANGGAGEPLYDYDARVTVEDVREAVSPVRLPMVQIRGRWYYKDDRLGEYRGVADPHDTLPMD